MKIRFILPAVLTCVLLQGCSLTKEEQADRMFKDYTGSGTPGAAVKIIHNGQTILEKVYGMADIENKIPVTYKTNFRLASVTKQFTAMCIMILEEQGRLKYETTLKEIFPDFPDYGNAITVQNVLQHTSGLIAYEDLIPDTVSVQVLDKDVLQKMMEQDSTYFEPGTDYRYSNSGYAVLAMIIEKLSEKTFAEFLKEYIFMPVGMNNSAAFQNGISTVPNRAYGYDVQEDSIGFSDQSAYSAVLGDGGIYSSLEDLTKWDQALYSDTLVSFRSLETAFTPFKETYGFGWRIDEYKGHRRLHHTGSTSGFRNVIQRFPDDKFTIIILTNRKEPDPAPLAKKLVDMYLIKN